MKFCPNCGAQYSDQYGFCEKCGTPLVQPDNTQFNQQYDYNAYNHYYNNRANMGIQPREIAITVLLSIVTCGIYGIYWMIKMNDEVNLLAGETNALSGGMVFLFTLITCGIYGWFWLYKMGERCERIKGVPGDLPIVYLLLGIFGLSIVSYCLIQDTINKAVA